MRPYPAAPGSRQCGVGHFDMSIRALLIAVVAPLGLVTVYEEHPSIVFVIGSAARQALAYVT